MVTQTIRVNLNQKDLETILAVQNDTLREIAFEFYATDAEEAVQLDPDDFTVKFNVLKPDNNFVMTTFTDGVIKLSDQMTAVTGTGYYCILLMQDDELIYSGNGKIIINDHVIGTDNIDSVSEADGYTFPDDFYTKDTPLAVLDDSSTSTTSTWSSNKINGEINTASTSAIAQLNAMKTGFDGVEYNSPAAMVTGCDQKIYDYIQDNIIEDLTLTINRSQMCDGNVGETIVITSDQSSWAYTKISAEYKKSYDITFYQPSTLTAPCIFLCDSSDIILYSLSGSQSGKTMVSVYISDPNIKNIYVRSNYNYNSSIYAKCRLVPAADTIENLIGSINDNKSNISKVVGFIDGTLESQKNADGKVGEIIAISSNNSWSYGVYDVSMDFKYNAKFYTTWTLAVPYVFLCDSNGLIKKTYGGVTANASNIIQITVDDPSITKIYVRSANAVNTIGFEKIVSSAGTINKETYDVFKSNYNANNTIGQLSSVVDAIGVDAFKDKKLTTVAPYKYSAWPYLGVIGDKIRCIYTVQDQHVAENPVYFGGLKVIESSNGIIWSEVSDLYPDTVVNGGGITGIGNDLDGNLLMWGRLDSAPYHSLYKMTADSMTLVVTLPNDMPRSHIGDIITGPNDKLYCFYNTYGNSREYGMLTSSDNGLTWTRKVIESGLSIAECPVEISPAYIEDNKILAIGRKDNGEGTVAMFQLQTSDAGETWSKQYTNITDAHGNTAALINDDGTLYLYYYVRGTGVLRKRVNTVESVWNHPDAWNAATTIATGSTSSLDSGQVKAVQFNGNIICSFYSGSTYLTGIYSVID